MKPAKIISIGFLPLFNQLSLVGFLVLVFVQCDKVCAQSFGTIEPSALSESLYDQRGLFCADSSHCTPGVIGMPRPKGIFAEYQVDPNYQLSPSDGSELSSGPEEAINHSTLSVGLRVPVIRSHHTKVIVGLKFRDENYRFAQSESTIDPFYQQLEDENLYSIGSSVYVTHYNHNKTYWLLRGKASLDGDFRQGDIALGRYLNFSFTPIYGWKKNHNLSFGIGASLKHAYGRLSLYPVLLYYRNFNQKWGLEAAIPSKLRVRYQPNSMNTFYLGARLEGTRNAVLFPYQSGNSLLALERADLRYEFRYEREIHDFLWLSTAVGLRQPISYRVVDNFSADFPRVYDANSNTTVYASVGIFIVPPKKWMK